MSNIENIIDATTILDVVKDIFRFALARNNIRAELKSEFKWNLKILNTITKNKTLSINELIAISTDLKFDELDAFIKYPAPAVFKCNRKVTEKVIGNLPATRLEGMSFIKLCRNIRDKIKFVKEHIDYFKRPQQALKNIQTYTRIANKLLN